MIKLLFAFVFVSVLLLVISSKAFRIAKDDELLVILRLGRVIAVHGPGRNLVMPFLDKAITVNLAQIPGWDKLSESELQLKAAQLVLGDDSGRYRS
jgi:regulator of protease activity HflC (stomatin/prohibitin superfamily)